MSDLIVTGLSSAQLSRRVKAGKIFKIMQGLYLTRRPTPTELAQILLDRYLNVALDGHSALAWSNGEEMQFPVEVASPSELPQGELFRSRRTQRFTFLTHRGFPTLPPLLAISCITDDDEAIRSLERAYAGPTGRRLLDAHLSHIPSLPQRVHALLKYASTGSDSPYERQLVRLLREAGFVVETNYHIRDYRWDLVLPRHKLAIEVDGFKHHHSAEILTFIRDRWKANDATLRGYRVLRYPATCIKHHSDRVLAQIKAACSHTQYLPGAVWLWHYAFRHQREELMWASYETHPASDAP